MPHLSTPTFDLDLEVEAKRAAEDGRFHEDDGIFNALVIITPEGHVTVREGAIPGKDGVTWPDGSYVQPWGIQPPPGWHAIRSDPRDTVEVRQFKVGTAFFWGGHRWSVVEPEGRDGVVMVMAKTWDGTDFLVAMPGQTTVKLVQDRPDPMVKIDQGFRL